MSIGNCCRRIGDLVADGDKDDVARRVEREDIRVNPLTRHVGIGRQRRYVSIGSSDDDPNSRVGERSYDCGIGAVEAHLSDGCGAQELSGGLWRRQVVGDLAVVYTDK